MTLVRLGSSLLTACLVLVLPAPARGALVCPNPAQVIDVTVPVAVAGDTTGQASNVDVYQCADSGFGPPGPVSGYSGPEDVYEFTLAAGAAVSFVFSPERPDMRLLLLGACDESTCRHEGGCGESLGPGTYFLVVDGLNGAAGRYSLTPYLTPAAVYNHWYDCPTCAGPSGCAQPTSTIGGKSWHFDEGYYCGTGCDFSMFAVVECGAELHLPFFDVETGRIQVFDVLGQRFVDLTATNVPSNPGAGCELTVSGPSVEWVDNGCTSIPCPGGGCGGGMDCHTNNVVMDVTFRGTASLCGVYRLDFLNWGGYAWDLFANCSGDRTEHFDIYRDQCSALANYNPLPEGSIDTLTVDESQCSAGQVSGTLLVHNAGCRDTVGLEISIEQCAPHPPNPSIYTVDVPAGGQVLLPWSFATTSTPVDLAFKVDPAGRTYECSDKLGGCSIPGDRVLSCSTVCAPTCQTVARAGPDGIVCAGSDGVLDGSTSTFACVSGGTPAYRFALPGGAPVPGCDWGPASSCAVPASLLPVGVHTFTLRTDCSGGPIPCEQTDTTTVSVLADGPPPPLGNVLRAVRAAGDVSFAWGAPGVIDFALYRLFKDADPQLPAGTRATVLDHPTLLLPYSADEAGAIGAPPTPIAFYQLVGLSCGGIQGPY